MCKNNGLRKTALFFVLLHFCCALFSQDLSLTKAEITGSELIVEKPTFTACHAATLVELSHGRILAGWFAGSRESSPDVSIWLATYINGVWDAPKIVADGIVTDSLRYACWNPVLFRNNKDRLFLFYKVGPTPRDWWGMMKYSDDEGNSWSKAEKLQEGMLGPVKNKPLQLRDGTILYPSSTESGDGKQWLIHIEKSDNNGQHWKNIPIACDSFGVIQPSILRYKNNKLQLLSRSRQNYILQCWSSDGGNTWSSLTKTNLPNPNSGIDAVSLRNGLQLLVYNPLEAGKEWYNGRNKLSVAISRKGNYWKNIIVLEDAPNGEYSYPAVIQTSNGLVHILYTYDRRNIKHIILQIK